MESTEDRLAKIEASLQELRTTHADYNQFVEQLGEYIHEVARLQVETFKFVREGFQATSQAIGNLLIIAQEHQRRLDKGGQA